MSFYTPPYYSPAYNQMYYPNYPMQTQQMNVPMNQPIPQQPMQPIQQMQVQPTIQKSNEIVPVPNKEAAMNYPVAPGNSVTFKDESIDDVIYTKTMGFSQLDKPKFEVIHLVKEENNEENNEQKEMKEPTESISLSVLEDINNSIQILDDEMKKNREDISNLKNRIDELSKRRNKNTVIKKEGEDNV